MKMRELFYRVVTVIMLVTVLLPQGSPLVPGGVLPILAQSPQDWQTTAWEDMASLPEAILPDGAVALNNGWVYVIDDTNVYHALVGLPIGWNTTNGPPRDGRPNYVVSDGTYIWQLPEGYQCDTYYTHPLMDGSLAPWQATTGTPWTCGPHPVGGHSYDTARGYLFAIGGFDTYPGSTRRDVTRIKINSDGSLGTGNRVNDWQHTADLPDADGRADARVASWGEWLYVLGGYECEYNGYHGSCGDTHYTRTVYYGHVENDGSINTWHTGPHLSKALSQFAVVTVDDALYVIGGVDNGVYSSRVYRSEIDTDGSLGEWKEVKHLQLPNGLYGHAAVSTDTYILTFGGHELGVQTDEVRRAVPTYHLSEINDRIDSDPEGIVGRPIFIRAMPVATWDPTFGAADHLKFAHFLLGLWDIGKALIAEHPVSFVVLGKAWAIGHFVESFVDSRTQVYVGVDLPYAGRAVAGADLPLGGIPQDYVPYVMHGTIEETSFSDFTGTHTLYYFHLENSSDFQPDTPSSSNPRFPVPAGTTWRPLPQLVDSHTIGQDYATIGVISKRFSYELSDVIVLSSQGGSYDTMYIKLPSGQLLPEKGNLVLVKGEWTTFIIEDDGGYILDGLSSTADDILCMGDRLNGCIESVIEGSVDLSWLQTLVVQTGSPVDVHLYDGQGRHTGALYDGSGNPIGVETLIPNSYYFPGDDEDPEAILVDVMQGSDYEIRVRGTGTGSYSLGQMIVPSGYTEPFTSVVPSVSTTVGQIDTYDVEGLPVPPSSITVTQIGPSQLLVSWTASPSADIAGYNIYLAQGNFETGGLRRANSSPVSGTSFVIDSVSLGADYQVGVTAVSSSWIESGFEQWISIHTKGYTYLPITLKSYTPGPQPPPPTNRPPSTPSNPSPSNGATNQSVTADLTWTGGDPDGDSLTSDVYFAANDNTPDTLLCNHVTSAACDPDVLSYNTHYYWQVIARDEHGATTTGPVWSFMTQGTILSFADDFSTDKGWVNQTSGHFSRDTTNKWLSWHVHRSTGEKYYIPITPYSGNFRLEAKVKATYWANNCNLFFGLAENLTGGQWADAPTGLFVDFGWYGGYPERRLIRARGIYADRPFYESERITYNMNQWYRIVFEVVGSNWTVTVYNESGGLTGQIAGAFPAVHSSFNYIILWSQNDGDWPTGDGLFDDLIVEGLEP